MSTLNQQVWISHISKNFYPESSFLNFVKDMSSLVNNDKINLAEAGLDPIVLINNTTYPIAVNQRVDTPREIELDLFETENDLVRRPQAIEYSYDKLESVIYGHRMALRAFTAMKAAHAFSPQQNTTFTPVLETTGADDGTGRKRMLVEDVLRLKTRFDIMDYPDDKRYLTLAPQHVEDLILFDLKAFKNITDFVDGKPNRFAGFQMLSFSKPAIYNATTKQKKPFGAPVAPETDTFSSFCFYGEEVMKADGEVHMYANENDPEQRGTIIGFDKRFIALSMRNRGIGSIISAKV